MIPYINKSLLNCNLVISGGSGQLHVSIKDLINQTIIYENMFNLKENNINLISINEKIIIENNAISLNLKSENKSLKLLSVEFNM